MGPENEADLRDLAQTIQAVGCGMADPAMVEAEEMQQCMFENAMILRSADGLKGAAGHAGARDAKRFEKIRDRKVDE